MAFQRFSSRFTLSHVTLLLICCVNGDTSWEGEETLFRPHPSQPIFAESAFTAATDQWMTHDMSAGITGLTTTTVQASNSEHTRSHGISQDISVVESAVKDDHVMSHDSSTFGVTDHMTSSRDPFAPSASMVTALLGDHVISSQSHMTSNAPLLVPPSSTLSPSMTVHTSHTHLEETAPTTMGGRSSLVDSFHSALISHSAFLTATDLAETTILEPHSTVRTSLVPLDSTVKTSLLLASTNSATAGGPTTPGPPGGGGFNYELILYVVPPIAVVLLCLLGVTLFLCCRRYRRFYRYRQHLVPLTDMDGSEEDSDEGSVEDVEPTFMVHSTSLSSKPVLAFDEN